MDFECIDHTSIKIKIVNKKDIPNIEKRFLNIVNNL